MLDFSHLADKNTANIQVFYASNNYQSWIKPRSINFIQFFALAGGNGGGGGTAPSSNIGGGGGAGGSPGQQTILTYAAWMIPDILRISVGFGGAGGAGASYVSTGTSTAGLGSVGSGSYVICDNSYLVFSDPSSYAGGTTAAVNSTGGINNYSYTSSYGGLSVLSICTNAGNSTGTRINANIGVTGSGNNGGAGGSINNGYMGSIAQVPSSPYYLGVTHGTGGGGGGGQAGGTISGSGNFPTVYGGAGGINGEDGSGGIQAIPGLFYFYGGTGGGGGSAGNGGNGGPGSYGCGGGGGGGAMGGVSGRKGGDGGRGGDGLVVVVAW